MSLKMEIKKEWITCPHCEYVQLAEVTRWHSSWWSYVHYCEVEQCGYTIMESEWERVTNTFPLSTKEAAKLAGVTTRYITRLCSDGNKFCALKKENFWLVDRASFGQWVEARKQ